MGEGAEVQLHSSLSWTLGSQVVSFTPRPRYVSNEQENECAPQLVWAFRKVKSVAHAWSWQ